jgi:hypothetical protein
MPNTLNESVVMKIRGIKLKSIKMTGLIFIETDYNSSHDLIRCLHSRARFAAPQLIYNKSRSNPVHTTRRPPGELSTDLSSYPTDVK